ncbi:MAG: tetratricopeptide repeat protein [Gemmataceae bacterium]|nr:tetratricopeptide repeat protein [Gemmata sp.]MDW8197615.1 tetratricopeptide repeat protein [Gemmataceae bacterium]
MLSILTRGCSAWLWVVLTAAGLIAQPNADQQAETILNAGRKAYNDGNAPFAAERFTEVLNKFGTSKWANDARYGLGLTLLDLPNPDYTKALEYFTHVINDVNFPQRASALYYAAVCQRALGLKEYAEGLAKPQEMPQRSQAAAAKFTEALKLFSQSREAFEKNNDAEWAARSRCDIAEMQLRLNKPHDARTTTEPLVKDPLFATSKYRPLGLYYHGTAAFMMNDMAAAAKTLGLLAPYDQPFGPHARYLRGRIHMADGENAEATLCFDAVVADYAKQKAAAVEALKQPNNFKNNPWEKTRLEALVNGPVPDYVAGSVFYAASLNYEAGKFAEALGKLEAFLKDYAASPLKDDALLRLGLCQVQTRQWDAAIKTLQPLANHPRLADQALLWIGKAQAEQAAAADPNNPNLKAQSYTNAINTLRSAAEKANRPEPEAKTRRGHILLELADTQLAANRPHEAAATYELLHNEKLLPHKAEEVLQRLITAYHLAGEWAKSEARIATFQQQFPTSPLLPFVLFRSAENSYAKAEQLARQNKAAEAQAAFTQAEKQYADVVTKFPEFEKVHRARFAQALCWIALRDYEKAIRALEAIPAPQRVGELASVAYVLADCQLRTAPAKAEDALQDNILREKLTAAISLLDGFIAAHPKAEPTPEALVKLGHSYKRLAMQLPPGNERNDLLNKARATLERQLREFPQAESRGEAMLERAQVLLAQGDRNGAINTLRGFTNDPLQKSPVAPLAMIAWATLLREQNQPAEAVKVLQQAREKLEGTLGAQQQHDRVALLRYHHGVALLESQKPAEARVAFEQAIQAAPRLPIAVEATLRALQAQAEERKQKIDELEKQKKPGLNPPQLAALDNQIRNLRNELIHVGKLFEQQAEQYRADYPTSETRARMLYEAAWLYRSTENDPAPVYRKLIEQFPELSLAVEARLEWAEWLAERGQSDQAIPLLRAAIDAEPTDKPTPPETLDRIRLRLGAAYFAKNDYDAAKSQFDAVGNNEKSPWRAHGLYRAAECVLAQGKPEEAQKLLAVFRDNAAFHNVAGVSDRALLRLGHALSQLKRWDEARAVFRTLISRFGNNNPWAIDALYGIAWTYQNLGRYDDAVNTYAQVTQATTDDRAGRAYLQIGLCRAATKKWADAGKAFETVYFGYDFPDLKFPAMIEHARVLVEDKKPDDAAKLLERLLKEAPPTSDWAKAAQELREKWKKQ